MSHSKNEARRAAYRLLVNIIDDFQVKYMEAGINSTWGDVPPEVRAELDGLKDTFAAAGTVKDGEYPEGWSPGDPPIGGCNCNECMDRRAKERAKKDQGRNGT